MKRFPNQRPARLAGLEDCLSVARRERGPRWESFWRGLAMGLAACSAGLLLAAAFFYFSGRLAS